MREAQPLQASISQQRGVDLAALGLAQPRFDIAAQQPDLKIGPQPLDLRLTP
jgi:hypothetical protein